MTPAVRAVFEVAVAMEMPAGADADTDNNVKTKWRKRLKKAVDLSSALAASEPYLDQNALQHLAFASTHLVAATSETLVQHTSMVPCAMALQLPTAIVVPYAHPPPPPPPPPLPLLQLTKSRRSLARSRLGPSPRRLADISVAIDRPLCP